MILVAKAFRIDQPYCIEMFGHSAIGLVIDGFSFIEIFCNQLKKVIQDMLLSFVVVKSTVLLNPTYIVEA